MPESDIIETSRLKEIENVLIETDIAELIIVITPINNINDLRKATEITEKGFNGSYILEKTILFYGMSPDVFCEFDEGSLSDYGFAKIIAFVLEGKLDDKIERTRYFLDLANRYDTHFMTVNAADIVGKDSSPINNWARNLFQPVIDGAAELVIPKFLQPPLKNSIGELFVFPLLASLYNTYFTGDLTGTLVIKRDLIQKYLSQGEIWQWQIGNLSLECWILINALTWNILIAESFIGSKYLSFAHTSQPHAFMEYAMTIFKHIADTHEIWGNNPLAVKSPLTYGCWEDQFLFEEDLDPKVGIEQFRRGYHRYYEPVWSRIFSEELSVELANLAVCKTEDFIFSTHLWSQLVYESLLAFRFNEELQKQDNADSLGSLFAGYMASYIIDVIEFSNCGNETTCPARVNSYGYVGHFLRFQTDIFLSRRQDFLFKWEHHQKETQPFLQEIAYMEYIPGIPILLPHIVKSKQEQTAQVIPVYEEMLKEYEKKFSEYGDEYLDLDYRIDSSMVGKEIENFVSELHEGLKRVLPGDMHIEDGISQFVNNLIGFFPEVLSYSLKHETAKKLLHENPPRNLLTSWNYYDTNELLSEHDSLDILALTTWSEEPIYLKRVNDWIIKEITPDDFEMSPVIPYIIDYRKAPYITDFKEAPSLNYLTSRVVVSNLRPGSGGKFPKIRYMTTILKSIIEAEYFGRAFVEFARNKKEFARKIVNCINGHWGMRTFSAHSIFETIQQLDIIERLKDLSIELKDSEDSTWRKTGSLLSLAAKTYTLGLTLPDGVFVTWCVWSWASYSSKGGSGLPTPLSLIIERRCFNTEMFFRCYELVGGKREDILPLIFDLMGQGRESQDLASSLLNVPEKDGTEMAVASINTKDGPPSGKLRRSKSNPIITSISNHDWESKYVLNSAALRLDERIFLLYRAVGEDGISRLGLAVTEDGHHISERLCYPIFAPDNPSEAKGCEDPRLVSIDGRIYMLYTAYDGKTPQISMASIDKKDMINYRWNKWHRHGLVFPGLTNKDAVLFPERFNGKYAMYHRIAPSIWLSYSETLNCPWPKEGHKIVMGPRSGVMWDAIKIGAGAQPLKTKYGWLHLYHGVDYRFCYRLGVFLTAINNPLKVLYRAPNPCLEPEDSFEIGIAGRSWVPNVVFTCGAVPAKNVDVLDDKDEILVYYGGADTLIGLASSTLADLLPVDVRKEIR
jgi:predicted GH43/DUF377 family glycosyl hydrolase